MHTKIKQLKESTIPEIDWKARHGVELNNGERNDWYDTWFTAFAESIINECAQHALDFNNNIQSLPDKVLRGNLHRVSDYIKDRMGSGNGKE